MPPRGGGARSHVVVCAKGDYGEPSSRRRPSEPTRLPKRLLGTAVNLSTIIRTVHAVHSGRRAGRRV